MLSWLWDFFKDSDNQPASTRIGTVIVAVCGGIVAVAKAIWAVVKFLAERKRADEKKGGDMAVTLSGTGIASGRDTKIRGNVKIGLDEEGVRESIREEHRPLVEQQEETNSLIKQLIPKFPTPAGPGAQQAVGEAIQSIAKGAAEGDSHLQQALRLLKENKIAEAAQLLNAFAEDKTARIETDRKEAAIAYRNLGAIAGLRDPKRALEAYEKALALDPDDIESLFRAGFIQINYGDLDKAQTRVEHVLKLAETGDQAVYKYRPLTGLGDIKRQRGDLPSALKSYEGGLAIIERLAKSGPGNAEWQYDLGISIERIGDIQMEKGDLGAALKAYEAKRDIISRHAKSDPSNAGWQRDLSVSYNKVGDMQMDQGGTEGALNALKSYRDALTIIEPLAKSGPYNALWQRDLSVAYNRVGDGLVAQDDLAGALKSYQDGLAIIEPLAKLDPSNAEWRRDLSMSYEKVGDVQVKQGDLAVALKSYNDSFAIRKRLAKSGPGNAEWQRDLSGSFAKLALVYRQSGDRPKALEALRQGHKIILHLTKLSPDNAQWKQGLAWFDRQIAELTP